MKMTLFIAFNAFENGLNSVKYAFCNLNSNKYYFCI